MLPGVSELHSAACRVGKEVSSNRQSSANAQYSCRLRPSSESTVAALQAVQHGCSTVVHALTSTAKILQICRLFME